MKFIRIRKVMDKTDLSRSTLYRLERDGLFPKKVKLGEHARAWVEAEVDEWCEARIRERDTQAA